MVWRQGVHKVSKGTFHSDEDAARQSSPSARVLIVDDYEPWRRWLYSELGKQPELQVFGEASDGLEAIRKVFELQPDVILLDIGLPNLSGIECASRIAQSVSGQPPP